MFRRKKEDSEEKEAFLDDLMVNRQMEFDSSQAKAEAIKKMSEKNDILTDYDDKHINIGTCLLTMDAWLNTNGINTNIAQQTMSSITKMRISRNRKSRDEIKEIVRTPDPNERGALGKLKDKIGF